MFKKHTLSAVLLLFCASGECLAVQYGTNIEVPYYVRAGNERVRAFKQGGTGCGIVIFSEVNQPKCFDNKMIYYIPNPPAIIEGNNTTVYIPSDTIIVCEYAPDNNSIVVRNGAKIITGVSGQQTNCFGSYPPVWIVTINDIPFTHNLRGLLLEDSASSQSWLNNIFVENCKTALETRPLDYSVTNIYADHCYKGIVFHGTGTVTNCQVTNFGKMADGILPYEGRGIEFVMTSIDGSVTYENAQYETTFNVVHNGDIGITSRGSDYYYSQMGAQNNAVTKCSRFAYDYTTNSYIYFTTGGFWDNVADYNNYIYLESPIYETSNPYDFVIGDYRAYLKPTSKFANYRDSFGFYYQNAYDFNQAGWTTDVNGSPDSNYTDIWIHHQSKFWTPTADLDDNGVVDYSDVWEFCSNWLAMENASDYDGNGFIDYRDLYILVANWLENDPNLDLTGDTPLNFRDFAILCYWRAILKDPRFADLTGDRLVNFLDYAKLTSSLGQLKPSLLLTDIDGNDFDRTSASDLIFIDFANFDANTYAIAVYLDNMLVDKNIALTWYPLELPTYAFSNGRHTLQCVTYDANRNGTIHRPVEVDFNNAIYYLDCNDRFYPGENFPVSGFTDLNAVVTKVLDENDSVLWSQALSGPGYVEVNIPGSVFNNQLTCTVLIESSSSPPITRYGITKTFKKTDYPATDPNYKMAIILPDKDVASSRKDAITACKQACQREAPNKLPFKWVELYNREVTPENLDYVLRQMQYIKYVYWAGHSNSYADEQRTVARTNLRIWKERRFWFNTKMNAFSHFTWPDPLDAKYTTGAFEMRLLEMHGIPSWGGILKYNKKLVVIDGCLSAEFGDMAAAFGAHSEHNCGAGWQEYDQIYIGWNFIPDEGTQKSVFKGLYGVNEGMTLFWDDMGLGNSVYHAFHYIQSQGDIGIRKTFFGNDLSVDDFGTPSDPCDIDHFIWRACWTCCSGVRNIAENVRLTNP
jgi:hypothetical protein